LTKGCYLGQEIVARMHARGQLARQIVGFRVDGDFLPLAGTGIFDEQSNGIGGVTSSTMSPILSDAAIGLALVKRPFNAIGSTLVIPAEGAMRTAKVVGLPFVKA
ncbi:MAG TPA: glycine cleavage T C-terminal barrel domain-containing protein, partial [Tepidisphaeraceae bacterium]|nr:glycine cleavage T C-terminal barrel domain-containing protein [Tepidisphaeraceae bacterium]